MITLYPDDSSADLMDARVCAAGYKADATMHVIAAALRELAKAIFKLEEAGGCLTWQAPDDVEDVDYDGYETLGHRGWALYEAKRLSEALYNGYLGAWEAVLRGEGTAPFQPLVARSRRVLELCAPESASFADEMFRKALLHAPGPLDWAKQCRGGSE